jgi:DNA-directed RNA polymerase subunit alpha
MTVGAVLEKSEDELLHLRNFGRKSYDELKQKLVEFGFLPESALTSGFDDDLEGLEEEIEGMDDDNPIARQLRQLVRRGAIQVDEPGAQE